MISEYDHDPRDDFDLEEYRMEEDDDSYRHSGGNDFSDEYYARKAEGLEVYDDDYYANTTQVQIQVDAEAFNFQYLLPETKSAQVPYPQGWIQQKNGDIFPHRIENVLLALKFMNLDLSYDEFTSTACLGPNPITDDVLLGLRLAILEKHKFFPSRDVTGEAVQGIALATPVHPIRRYLNSLEWDGESRIDNWLTTYLGAVVENDKHREYVTFVGRAVLLAAIRRITNPGAKFDELMILEGRQGTGKSSAIRMLCPQDRYFSDSIPLGVDPKESVEGTKGIWIAEIADINGGKSEVSSLKAFLSRMVDGPFRGAFARIPQAVPRQFILIGTTNEGEYLFDSTGGRRFWPIKTSKIDLPALERDRNQLWAEARARRTERITLPPELWAEAAIHQKEREVLDPWQEILEIVIPSIKSEDTWISTTSIRDRLGSGFGGASVTIKDKFDNNRLARVMRALGYEPCQQSHIRGWIKA